MQANPVLSLSMNTKTLLPISSRSSPQRPGHHNGEKLGLTNNLFVSLVEHDKMDCKSKDLSRQAWGQQNGAALHGGTFAPTGPSAYSLSKGDKLQHRLRGRAVCNQHFAKGKIFAVSSSLRQCAHPSSWMVRLGRPPKANSDVN
eukprot:1964870-Amphidinium_carterae.1